MAVAAAGLARPGIVVAACGATLELVGLVWDAVRHARDPGLSAHEELFSFDDPSHVLLIVGIGVAAAGLAFELISVGQSSLGRLRRQGLVLGIALIALLAANAGVLLVSVATAPADQHADAHGTGLRPNDPVSTQLAGTLRSRGLPAALDELSALAEKDRDVLARAHDLAHMIGELAVVGQPNVSKVMRECRDTFLYGCYHGALKAYFANKVRTRPADVVGVCPTDLGTLLVFQCLHGLGHGVLANLDYDLFRALIYCDALGTENDRRSCYGGVFMENVVVALEQVAGRATGEQAGAHVFLRPDDAQYPCDVVAEKYRPSCYQLQTTGMLLYNGRDYGKAALACDAAPAMHVAICFESLGRDISGDALRDDSRVLASCDGLPSRNRAGCFVGAVRNLLDSPERTMPFCSQVPDYAKALCYTAAGEQLALNYPRGDARRATACAGAEAAYWKACEDAVDRH